MGSLALVRPLADHDILRSAYTAEGTFTYDQALDFFANVVDMSTMVNEVRRRR